MTIDTNLPARVRPSRSPEARRSRDRTLRKIIACVSRVSGIPEEVILSNRQEPAIVRWRHAGMALAYEQRSFSQNAIGEAFGKDGGSVAFALGRGGVRDWTVNKVLKKCEVSDAVVSRLKILREAWAEENGVNVLAKVSDEKVKQAGEIRALRKRGWTIAGLARHFGRTEAEVRAVVGEDEDA